MPTIEEEVRELKAKVAGLQRPSKDLLDYLQVIGTLLVPAAVAIAGYLFTREMKQAEIQAADAQRQIEQARTDRDYAIASVNARLGQGGFVRTLLEDLLSQDIRKQKLASEAVLIVLPEDGPRLLRALEVSGSPEARGSATAALEHRRPVLIGRLFADSASRRQAAYEALVGGWGNDPAIVPELISAARDNKENENGVYNTLVLLSHMNRDALKPHLEAIDAFSKEMETVGPRTKGRAEVLRSRLPK
jgi:hypothetical protein